MPSDRDIVLSIGMDTQDAEKSMQSFEDASKRFSAALSQVMKLPNTNLERVISKLRSSANAYGKARAELAKIQVQKDEVKGEITEGEERLAILNKIVAAYNKLNSVKGNTKDARAAKSEIEGLYAKLNLAKPDLTQDVREKSFEKVNNLLDKQRDKVLKLRETYDKLEEGATAAQGRMTQKTQEYINTQRELSTALATDIWQKPVSSIATYIAKLADLTNGNNNAEQALLRFRTVVSGIWNDFKKLISRVRNFIKLVGKLSGISALIKRIRTGLDSRGIDWKTGLRYIIQYGLGFRSLFFLVRRLRTALVDALKDMGKSIPRVQEGLDRISVSMNTLKGSLAVAFAPLLKVVAGLMERLAATAIRAANAIAQFFAVITGQNVWFRLSSGISSYTDAVKGSTAATKENEKELKKQLADFDDIDVLVKDVGDDLEDVTPGGSGGLDGSELGNWEEVARPMSKLAELIKEAWTSDDVLQAFEEVGRYIGEALQDALESLLTDFWPPIRKKAERIAEAIAGTINGFFQTDAVVYLAKNIAAAINTALSTLSKYWNGVNWGDMGAKLQESIQALIESIEWRTLAEYLKGKIKGIIEFAANLIGDGSWITELSSRISMVIEDILKNVDFQKLGATINTFLTSLLDGINGVLKKNKKGVSKAVNDFLVGLNFGEVLHSLAELVFTVAETALTEGFKLILSSKILTALIVAWLLAELGKFVIPAAITALISRIITSAITTGMGEAVAAGTLGTVVSTAATNLFGLFSGALTLAFSGLGVLLGSLVVAGVIEYIGGESKTAFEIMNEAVIADTQSH